ncbi:MAG: heme-binding protein [Planctomycetota bacterium]
MRVTFFTALIVILSTPIWAQTLDQKTLSLAGAKRAVDAAAAGAKSRGAGGVFAVVDSGGHLLCLERLDGTFPAGANIAVGKARTAALFKKSTRVFEEIIAGGRTAMVTIDGFTPLKGGVPIVIDGQVVGAIGVSGAMSADQDEELALIGVTAAGGSTSDETKAKSAKLSDGPMGARIVPAAANVAAPFGVRYLANSQVRESLTRGEALVEHKNYGVYAARREGPGQAELHELATDIFYVLDGHATLVTGGTIVGKTTAGEGEIRGVAIADGVAQALAPGDVVVVPRGTAHWFRDVHAPLLYFAVKVASEGERM